VSGISALTLQGADTVLLCSDMHLDDADPNRTAAFVHWLGHASQDATWILLLGDVFDAWVGDDQMSFDAGADSPPAWEMLADGLAQARRHRPDRPLQVGVLVGNRDFLIGPALCERLSAALLAPFVTVSHPGLAAGPALLCHGDELCTADTDYQAWRSQARSDHWQKTFLSRPLKERMEMARALRARSEEEKTEKPMALMDVVPEEADAVLQTYGADVLVHGHTHLPGCTALPSGRRRWVLPDWSVTPGAHRGGGLRIDAEGLRSVPFSLVSC
jgi:UDP-2,3-diacylglucosamine hydrolase